MLVRRFNNFKDFAKLLTRISEEYPRYEHAFLNQTGHYLADFSKSLIGHLQHGGMAIPDWKELAPATKKDKTDKGYVFNSEFNPLFRTGDLMNSISYSVVQHTVYIGSDDPVAVYQEMGVPEKNLPARSFLGLAMYKNKLTLEHALGDFLLKWITYRPPIFDIKKMPT